MVLPFLQRKYLQRQPIAQSVPIRVDVNAHILPGFDNGTDTFADSLLLLKQMAQSGYRRVVLTPHIMQQFYQPSPESIRKITDELQQSVNDQGLPIELTASALYYADGWLLKQLREKCDLLTFSPRQGALRYLLFETSLVALPKELPEIIELLHHQGITPVFSQPERCVYLYKNFELVRELHSQGVLFQLNANALVGYYSGKAQQFAEKIIEENLVYFIGSDCHNATQLALLENARLKPHFLLAQQLGLLNNTLA